MSGFFETESLYEWACPVCGYYMNMGREYIGDPPKCPTCGHYMRPKKYYTEVINPYEITGGITLVPGTDCSFQMI